MFILGVTALATVIVFTVVVLFVIGRPKVWVEHAQLLNVLRGSGAATEGAALWTWEFCVHLKNEDIRELAAHIATESGREDAEWFKLKSALEGFFVGERHAFCRTNAYDPDVLGHAARFDAVIAEHFA